MPALSVPAAGVDFRNYQYVGDGVGNGLDRTREGYIEIFNMADIPPNTVTSSLFAAVKHTTVTPPAGMRAELQGLKGG